MHYTKFTWTGISSYTKFTRHLLLLDNNNPKNNINSLLKLACNSEFMKNGNILESGNLGWLQTNRIYIIKLYFIMVVLPDISKVGCNFGILN